MTRLNALNVGRWMLGDLAQGALEPVRPSQCPERRAMDAGQLEEIRAKAEKRVSMP